jgi:hypothetical protein
MPAYDICYLKEDGSLAAKLSASFDNALKAKVLAHAMRVEGTRQIEVWDGRTLVYARPERSHHPLTAMSQAEACHKAA